ncbi:NADPH-dependent F420 reductase [bacterium]|nr:MAG: NADPH-dependent F420 reductase [bacterium]
MTEQPAPIIHTIAIVGGTGKEGKGLAYRWARAGYHLIIGSRQLEKAQAAAIQISDLLGGQGEVEGMENPQAARAGDLVVITVPFSAHQPTLEGLVDELHGKLVIDVTVPLVPPRVSRVQMPPAGSAAQEAQQILGPETRVIAAFQNISYEHLLHDEPVECDVLVCGGDKAARGLVVNLIRDMGLVAFDAGPIENAVVVEGLTSVLIGINKQYGIQSAGIRITGIPRQDGN